MDNVEDVLKDKNLALDLSEPAADDLVDEDELLDEELAITADNVDAFADD